MSILRYLNKRNLHSPLLVAFFFVQQQPAPFFAIYFYLVTKIQYSTKVLHLIKGKELCMIEYKTIVEYCIYLDLVQDGVKESISITGRIHEQWFEGVSVTTIAYAVWRYIALSNGVLRLTPGTTLDKTYDPTIRTWYVV